MVKVSV